jgi:hypothetical protein
MAAKMDNIANIGCKVLSLEPVLYLLSLIKSNMKGTLMWVKRHAETSLDGRPVLQLAF